MARRARTASPGRRPHLPPRQPEDWLADRTALLLFATIGLTPLTVAIGGRLTPFVLAVPCVTAAASLVYAIRYTATPGPHASRRPSPW
jgi:hypothetical protein